MPYPATEHIARFATQMEFADIPSAAVETAKIGLQDCLGVALAGSADEAGSIAAGLARAEGAREESSVIGHGFRTSAQQAAFANGVAAHALDYDHSFWSGGQPTAPVIPAAMAMAEAVGADGRGLLTAYAIGFEVTAKISRSLYTTVQHAWHAPGNMGLLGATAACARLAGLSTDQVRYALGMAVSMAGGVEANFGTMTKPLHVGQAARNAVVAAKLAGAGFTANPEAIESHVGYYDAYYRVAAEDDSPLDELGTRWDLAESGLRIKPYPCGGLAHTAIDAALALRASEFADGAGLDTIEAVDVEVTDRTFERIVFGVPRTELEAKFSMPYLIARALVDGRVGLDAFTDEAIGDAGVLAVARKVTMRLGAGLKSTTSGRPSVVSARLRDGRTLTQRVGVPKGGEASPMTPEELRAKFDECAARVLSPAAADGVVRAIHGLDGGADVGALTALLRA